MELAAGSEIRGGIDMKLFRRTLCIGAAGLATMLVLPGASMAQDVVKIRASIDTNLQHTRSKAFQMLAEEPSSSTTRTCRARCGGARSRWARRACGSWMRSCPKAA
jgi:hypothetical protein